MQRGKSRKEGLWGRRSDAQGMSMQVPPLPLLPTAPPLSIVMLDCEWHTPDTNTQWWFLFFGLFMAIIPFSFSISSMGFFFFFGGGGIKMRPNRASPAEWRSCPFPHRSPHHTHTPLISILPNHSPSYPPISFPPLFSSHSVTLSSPLFIPVPHSATVAPVCVAQPWPWFSPGFNLQLVRSEGLEPCQQQALHCIVKIENYPLPSAAAAKKPQKNERVEQRGNPHCFTSY